MSANPPEHRTYAFARREITLDSLLLREQRERFVAEYIASNDETVARTRETIADSMRLLRRLDRDRS